MKPRVCVFCLYEYLRKEAFVQRMSYAKIQKRVAEMTR